MADGRPWGIDISHNDNKGIIDWSAALAVGVSFAYAKATEGLGFTDLTFANSWKNMKNAGILRGAYHFIGLPPAATQPQDWAAAGYAAQQVSRFMSVWGGPQSGDLPPMIDIESDANQTRWASLMSSNPVETLGFVHDVIAALQAQISPVIPIIYCGGFWRNTLGDPQPSAMPLANCPLWLSQYPSIHPPQPNPYSPGTTDQGEANSFAEYTAKLDGSQPPLKDIPHMWGGGGVAPAVPGWKIWQFTEMGNYPAICNSNLDLDVFNGTPADLQSFLIP